MSRDEQENAISPPPEATELAPISFVRKAYFLILAGLFFGLSLLGVILPGVPTTPFLLLTSYCLVRSSPRLNALLLRSRLFGPVLADWQLRGGVRKRIKAAAIATVVLFVGTAALFFVHSVQLRVAIGCLAIIGIVVIVALPNPRTAESPHPAESPIEG